MNFRGPCLFLVWNLASCGAVFNLPGALAQKEAPANEEPEKPEEPPEPETVAPSVVLTSTLPEALTSESSVTFSLLATDEGGSGLASVECSLDSEVFVPCSSSSAQSYGALAEGSHRVQVRAIDGAGNVGAPAAHTWTVLSVSTPIVDLRSSQGVAGGGVGAAITSWSAGPWQAAPSYATTSLEEVAGRPVLRLRDSALSIQNLSTLPQNAAARTVQIWFKPASFGGIYSDWGWGQLLNWGTVDGSGGVTGLGYHSNGSLVFWGNNQDFDPGFSLVEEAWNFVVATVTPQGSITVFHNSGRAADARTGTLAPFEVAGFTLHIGGEYVVAPTRNGYRAFFDGDLMRVSVWDRVLTNQEIENLFRLFEYSTLP